MTVRRAIVALFALGILIGAFGAWLLWARSVGLRFE